MIMMLMTTIILDSHLIIAILVILMFRDNLWIIVISTVNLFLNEVLREWTDDPINMLIKK